MHFTFSWLFVYLDEEWTKNTLTQASVMPLKRKYYYYSFFPISIQRKALFHDTITLNSAPKRSMSKKTLLERKIDFDWGFPNSSSKFACCFRCAWWLKFGLQKGLFVSSHWSLQMTVPGMCVFMLFVHVLCAWWMCEWEGGKGFLVLVCVC